jgi:hypothetical protein
MGGAASKVVRRSRRGLLFSLTLHAVGALSVARLAWLSGAPTIGEPPRPVWVMTLPPSPKAARAGIEERTVGGEYVR